MAELNHTCKLKLDIGENERRTSVHAKQLDKGTRRFTVTLLTDKSVYAIPSGVTARLRARKPDGTKVLIDGTINGNTIDFTLTETVLAMAGRIQADVALYSGSSLVLSSGVFYIDVEAMPYLESDVTSSDTYSSLTEILGSLETINGILSSVVEG